MASIGTPFTALHGIETGALVPISRPSLRHPPDVDCTYVHRSRTFELSLPASRKSRAQLAFVKQEQPRYESERYDLRDPGEVSHGAVERSTPGYCR